MLDDFNSYSTNDQHSTLRRLACSVAFVRVTVVVGWISMVAIVALLALVLDRTLSDRRPAPAVSRTAIRLTLSGNWRRVEAGLAPERGSGYGMCES